MMLKREKGLFVIYGIVVLILYLLSSTNLIIKEKKVEIYPISVIIEDTKDDYYQNFKKGMDQAARAFHVDTSFITLYEAHDWEQQMELLEREINDGARAVVLAPVDAEQTLLYLEEKKMVTPVILLGTNGSNDWVSDTISMDYFQAGEKLGTMFAEENPVDIPVCICLRKDCAISPIRIFMMGWSPYWSRWGISSFYIPATPKTPSGGPSNPPSIRKAGRRQ
ncbi:MAG: substrate-binding domain-containing protein [Lachnospiraceae bacterium]